MTKEEARDLLAMHISEALDEWVAEHIAYIANESRDHQTAQFVILGALADVMIGMDKSLNSVRAESIEQRLQELFLAVGREAGTA